jgi:transposase
MGNEIKLIKNAYIDLNLSRINIAKMFDWKESKVKRILKINNIKKPSKKLDKKHLEQLYTIQKMDTVQIGKKVNVAPATISTWLKEYNIPIRTTAESKIQKGNGKIPTKKELIELYVDEKMSGAEIGKIYNINSSTVLSYLNKHNIPKRTSSETTLIKSGSKGKIPTKNELFNLYNNQGLSCAQIAKKYNIHGSTIENYLKRYDIKSRNVKESRSLTLQNRDIWLDDTKFSEYITSQNPKLTLKQISEFFNANISGVGQRIIKLNLSDDIKYVGSYLEEDILKWLKKNDVNYTRRNRKILNGKELDFIIEDKKIAIEVNDTWTHNSTKGPFDKKPKTKNYHFNKTLAAKEAGYQLIHIFEKDIPNLDLILHSLIKKQITGASKLKLIKDIDCKEFLNNNHRQRAGTVSKGYALIKEGIIYSCMTFRKSRNKSNGDMELYRYCVKKGWNVKFSAERLFKNFIKENPNKKIVSYCDLTYNKCTVYKKLGFKLSHISKPNYKWVKEDKWLSRESCQKHKLVKQGYNRNMTEKEIMGSRDYVQVFDCGNMVFLWDS